MGGAANNETFQLFARSDHDTQYALVRIDQSMTIATSLKICLARMGSLMKARLPHLASAKGGNDQQLWYEP